MQLFKPRLTKKQALKQLLNLSVKRLVLKTVTKDSRRINLERKFELTFQRILDRWFRHLSRKLKREGKLGFFVGDARELQLAGATDEELKERAEDITRIVLAEDLQDELEGTNRRSSQFQYTLWSRRAYELGAVESLLIMGFSATTPRLEKIKSKVLVNKAIEFEFGLTDEEIIAALENRAIIFGIGITQTIIEDIRRLVRDGVYLGNDDIDDIAEAIASGSGIPEWRALKIARTETQVAFSKASFDMYARSNVPEVTWLTVGDSRVRPEHRSNNGVARRLGDSFPSGQIHPGDPGPAAPLHINCRCTLVPDLSDPRTLLLPWDGSSGPFLSK